MAADETGKDDRATKEKKGKQATNGCGPRYAYQLRI